MSIEDFSTKNKLAEEPIVVLRRENIARCKEGFFYDDVDTAIVKTCEGETQGVE